MNTPLFREKLLITIEFERLKWNLFELLDSLRFVMLYSTHPFVKQSHLLEVLKKITVLTVFGLLNLSVWEWIKTLISGCVWVCSVSLLANLLIHLHCLVMFYLMHSMYGTQLYPQWGWKLKHLSVNTLALYECVLSNN